MNVIDHSTLPRLDAAGRRRFSAVGTRLGFTSFELWVEALDPNARADLQPHDRDRAVLVQAGHGSLLLDGAPQRFHAPCTLILPADMQCELVNIGATPMQLVVAIAALPVAPAVGPPAPP